jgi:serine/threonine protein kinase
MPPGAGHISCPACGRALSAEIGGKFCPHCGAVIDAGAAPTATSPHVIPQVMQPRGGGAASSRFLPGAIVADRYRMIGLLGRGGMGEVYRADDMKLGLPVALKFLPENVERDPDRLERFVAEVRTSLRVTHPNVCRVFDVGQIGERHFLSMEYVDGEDLGSLLRRIGRLPEDKAVEISRQLCAGLAAAHDEGVLHRDLKPANIMIDGRGRAKITDFGLAGAAGISGAEARAGTPQYMAPEQASGGTLTERTDIYALGLVLYELFTGKRAFEIRNTADLEQLTSSTPTSPSSHVSGLNPLVERAIMRCLEPDPKKRPLSAAALAAALPGGDPLAMAIAAGDTPSPAMVAAAGSDSGLQPSIAWPLGLFSIAGAIVAALLTSQLVIGRVSAPTKPPDVLIDHARQLLRDLSFPSPAHDSAWGLGVASDYLNHVAAGKPVGPSDTNAVRASYFWYRQSPHAFERTWLAGFGGIQSVQGSDPPMNYSGEVLVELDPLGRVRDFTAIPPQVIAPADATKEVDWSILFRAAGLDPAVWVPAESKWLPRFFGDRLFAWTPRDASAGGPTRVEAASFRDLPINFYLIFPWTSPARVETTTRTQGQQVADVVVVTIFAAILAGAVVMARRNLRLDRADLQGAKRLAVFTGVISMIAWALEEHHVAPPWELLLIVMAAAWALFVAALVACYYLAFEPHVRRSWPSMLVSWSRLISGSIRDPLVARDVLIGCATGVALELVLDLGYFASRWQTGVLPNSYLMSPRPFLGSLSSIAEILGDVQGAIVASLMFLFVLFVVRRVIRNDWLAPIAAGIVIGTPQALAVGMPTVLAIVGVIITVLNLLLLARVGLVAYMTVFFVGNVVAVFPFVVQMNTWYAKVGLAGVVIVSALALLAMREAMAPARAIRTPSTSD